MYLNFITTFQTYIKSHDIQDITIMFVTTINDGLLSRINLETIVICGF